MNRQKSTRSSRGSNSNTSNDSDPREKMKDCCRKLVAFMFTQVGVGAVIVAYALCGALVFIEIESTYDNVGIRNMTNLKNNFADRMWNITEETNLLNNTVWITEISTALHEFQTNVTKMMNEGYEKRKPEEIWQFGNSLLFCLSVFSMIGYGNTVPKTDNGKVFTMIYATFGIPLYILYFMNMGKVLAGTFRWLYTWFHECSHDQDKFTGSEEGSTVMLPKIKKKVIVPSTACLWVISFYIASGTITFREWEQWGWIDSVYFVAISLCKIGFGDIVPGAPVFNDDKQVQSKLYINFIFILFGMGLVAMCYKLMREEVREKFREMKEDSKLCMEDITKKFAKCFGNADRNEDFEEKFY